MKIVLEYRAMMTQEIIFFRLQVSLIIHNVMQHDSAHTDLAQFAAHILQLVNLYCWSYVTLLSPRALFSLCDITKGRFQGHCWSRDIRILSDQSHLPHSIPDAAPKVHMVRFIHTSIIRSTTVKCCSFYDPLSLFILLRRAALLTIGDKQKWIKRIHSVALCFRPISGTYNNWVKQKWTWGQHVLVIVAMTREGNVWPKLYKSPEKLIQDLFARQPYGMLECRQMWLIWIREIGSESNPDGVEHERLFYTWSYNNGWSLSASNVWTWALGDLFEIRYRSPC